MAPPSSVKINVQSPNKPTAAHNAVGLSVLMLPVLVPTIVHNPKASAEQE
jgi:hypothetical protein